MIKRDSRCENREVARHELSGYRSLRASVQQVIGEHDILFGKHDNESKRFIVSSC